jgi:hypothetical protein
LMLSSSFDHYGQILRSPLPFQSGRHDSSSRMGKLRTDWTGVARVRWKKPHSPRNSTALVLRHHRTHHRGQEALGGRTKRCKNIEDKWQRI